MNKKTIVNCIVVLAVLIGGNVAVSYIRAGYEMGAVVPPESDLADASLNLGSWVGKDLPEDPRLRQILRAKSGVDRVYQNPKKGDVLVHAVWTDDYIRLHFPQQCYRESGWEMTDSKTIEVEQANGNSFPAKICNFVQDGKQIQVLYWFQLGEHVFLDRMQHRLLRRKVCWGQREWPPLMKFMLETANTGLGRSEEALIEMASLLDQEISKTASETPASSQPAA